jgi:hypothetical protein
MITLLSRGVVAAVAIESAEVDNVVDASRRLRFFDEASVRNGRSWRPLRQLNRHRCCHWPSTSCVLARVHACVGPDLAMIQKTNDN